MGPSRQIIASRAGKMNVLKKLFLKRILLIAIDFLNDKLRISHGSGCTQIGEGTPNTPSNSEAAIARNCRNEVT